MTVKLLIDRKFRILCIVLLALAAIMITNQITLRNFPNSGDEYTYLISAKLFSNGKLAVPSPQHKEFFDFFNVINDGKFYGKYPPGWPFFLAFGEFISLPMIINLCFALLTLLVVYLLAEELFSMRVATFSLLLMMTSPYFIFNSASYFSHSSSLFFLAFFVYLYLKTQQSPTKSHWFFLGIILGVSFTIRQLDTLVFGICILIHYLDSVIKKKKTLRGEIIPGGIFLSGFFIVFSVWLLYNYLQTGNPFLLPFNKYNPFDKLGFLPPYSTSIKLALQYNLMYRMIRLNIWAPICCVFIIIGIFSKSRYHKESIYLLLAFFFSLLLAYFSYMYSPGYQYGPRYLYSASFAIFILAALGVESLMDYAGKKYGGIILTAILLMNLSILVSFSFLFHRQVNGRLALYDRVKQENLSNAIVFLKSGSGSMTVGDLTRNGIYFNDPVLYVQNFDQKNRLLMNDFPERTYYLWACDKRKMLYNKIIDYRDSPPDMNCSLTQLTVQ